MYIYVLYDVGLGNYQNSVKTHFFSRGNIASAVVQKQLQFGTLKNNETVSFFFSLLKYSILLSICIIIINLTKSIMSRSSSHSLLENDISRRVRFGWHTVRRGSKLAAWIATVMASSDGFRRTGNSSGRVAFGRFGLMVSKHTICSKQSFIPRRSNTVSA